MKTTTKTKRIETKHWSHFLDDAPTSMDCVNEWERKVVPVGQIGYDENATPIEEEIAEIVAEVPKEEWEKLPPDLTDHLDHYIYGTPKK